MVTLGLDPANKFGWAIGIAGKITAFGMHDVAKQATQMRCQNVTACYGWLRKLIREHNVTVVCAEDAAAAFSGVAALKSHARYAGIIDLVCEQLGIERVDSVHPTKLKAWACGNGAAKKDQMIRTAQQMYGINVKDDNAADACHVCAWAMHEQKVAEVRKRALESQAPW